MGPQTPNIHTAWADLSCGISKPRGGVWTGAVDLPDRRVSLLYPPFLSHFPLNR